MCSIIRISNVGDIFHLFGDVDCDKHRYWEKSKLTGNLGMAFLFFVADLGVHPWYSYPGILNEQPFDITGLIDLDWCRDYP